MVRGSARTNGGYMEFKKLVSPSLKGMFVEQIQTLILSGELAVGEKLPSERVIAQSMGISRAVVNCGIIELERMGFLEVKPRVGAFVTDYRRKGTLETLKAIMSYNRGRIRDEEVRSILEMRDALDKLAVEGIIKHATKEEFKNLYVKVESIKESLTPEKAARAAFAFQHEMAVLSGNTLLPLIFRSFYFSVLVLWERFCTLYGRDTLYKNSITLWEYMNKGDLQGAIEWIEHCTYESVEGSLQIYYK